MNWKKTLLAVAIAAVIFSCVIAAGCTTTTTSETPATTDPLDVTDPLVGEWTNNTSYKGITSEQTQTFLPDGTGTCVINNSDTGTVTYPFTWEKISNSDYLVHYDNKMNSAVYIGGEPGKFYEQQIWIYTNNGTVNAENPIVGTWTAKSNTAEYTDTFNADGTGNEVKKLNDGTTKNYQLTWVKDGSYYFVTREDGNTYAYDCKPEDKKLVAKEAWRFKNDGTVNKENPIVTSWKLAHPNNNASASITFKDDGTAALTQTNSSGTTKDYTVSWDKIGEGYLVKNASKETGIAFWVLVSDDGKSLTMEDDCIFIKNS